MMKENNNPENTRVKILIKEAAKQYVDETQNEMPSLKNSFVTIPDNSDNTEIVALLDKNRKILANYQHLKDFKFFRLDKND